MVTESEDTWETNEVEQIIINDEVLLGLAKSCHSKGMFHVIMTQEITTFIHEQHSDFDWSLVDWDEVYRTVNDEEEEPDVSHCPACGNPIDSCQGHGEIGDPEGWSILRDHDEGEHERCHYSGCEERARQLAQANHPVSQPDYPYLGD